MRPVTGRQALLVALLRDVDLAFLSSRLPGSKRSASQGAAAGEILAAQARLVRQLRDWGVVETTPGGLFAVVINQYLDVKARHLQ